MKITTLDLGEYKPHLTSPGVGNWRYGKKLPLSTRSGQLRLIALGVGGAFSSKMYQSNFIIVKGANTLFVDAGSKTTLKLAEFHLSAHDIQNLLITHSHADHIGSLEELALKRRYEAPFIEMPKKEDEDFPAYFKRMLQARTEGRFRQTIYVPEHYENLLWQQSLRGGLAFSEKVDDKSGEMDMSHYFKVVHPRKLARKRGRRDCWEFVAPGKTKRDDIHIVSFLTNHIPDSAHDWREAAYTTGFVIDGRVLVSGDTKYDPEMVDQFGSGCDAIFHDCQHFPGGVHASYAQLKELPPKVKERMYLYHLSDGMLEIDVLQDGFAGMMEPAPTVYDF